MTRNEFNRAVTTINTNDHLSMIGKKRQENVLTVARVAAKAALNDLLARYKKEAVESLGDNATEEEKNKAKAGAVKTFAEANPEVSADLARILADGATISTVRDVFEKKDESVKLLRRAVNTDLVPQFENNRDFYEADTESISNPGFSHTHSERDLLKRGTGPAAHVDFDVISDDDNFLERNENGTLKNRNRYGYIYNELNNDGIVLIKDADKFSSEALDKKFEKDINALDENAKDYEKRKRQLEKALAKDKKAAYKDWKKSISKKYPKPSIFSQNIFELPYRSSRYIISESELKDKISKKNIESLMTGINAYASTENRSAYVSVKDPKTNEDIEKHFVMYDGSRASYYRITKGMSADEIKGATFITPAMVEAAQNGNAKEVAVGLLLHEREILKNQGKPLHYRIGDGVNTMLQGIASGLVTAGKAIMKYPVQIAKAVGNAFARVGRKVAKGFRKFGYLVNRIFNPNNRGSVEASQIVAEKYTPGEKLSKEAKKELDRAYLQVKERNRLLDKAVEVESKDPRKALLLQIEAVNGDVRNLQALHTVNAAHKAKAGIEFGLEQAEEAAKSQKEIDMEKRKDAKFKDKVDKKNKKQEQKQQKQAQKDEAKQQKQEQKAEAKRQKQEQKAQKREQKRQDEITKLQEQLRAKDEQLKAKDEQLKAVQEQKAAQGEKMDAAGLGKEVKPEANVPAAKASKEGKSKKGKSNSANKQ